MGMMTRDEGRRPTALLALDAGEIETLRRMLAREAALAVECVKASGCETTRLEYAARFDESQSLLERVRRL